MDSDGTWWIMNDHESERWTPSNAWNMQDVGPDEGNSRIMDVACKITTKNAGLDWSLMMLTNYTMIHRLEVGEFSGRFPH